MGSIPTLATREGVSFGRRLFYYRKADSRADSCPTQTKMPEINSDAFVGGGAGIRTRNLEVMGLARCHFSTPLRKTILTVSGSRIVLMDFRDKLKFLASLGLQLSYGPREMPFLHPATQD